MGISLNEEAFQNLKLLMCNLYPGRGIVLGRTPNGDLAQIYFVTGRRESSQNRILKPILGLGTWVETLVADPSKATGDSSLLLYNAMAQTPGIYVISNGVHTKSILENGIISLMGPEWQYEPDTDFTPRIGGVIRCLSDGKFSMSLAILKKSPFGMGCDRFLYNYNEVAPGFGYFISTYERDGNPLPSFQGEPQLISIEKSEPDEIAEELWTILDPNNRVAVAVKVIPADGRPSEISIINRHEIG